MPPTDRTFFNAVFEGAQEAAGCGSEFLKARIKVLAQNSRNDPNDHERVLGWQFAQFIVGAVGATSALRRHELNEAGDWLAWSLTETIEEGMQQHLVIGRLQEFLNPMITSWEFFGEIYVNWFSDFYYYARSRAAMPEIAKNILPLALSTVRMMWKGGVNETLASAAGNILAWSAQEFPEAISHIANLVEEAASDPETDGRARLVLAITLASKPGEQLGVDRAYWRSLALNELSTWHRDHERLQLLIEELCSRDEQAIFDEVIREIDKHQSWVAHHSAENVDVYRGFDALASLLMVALHSCLSRRQTHRVLKLLAHWYRIPEAATYDDDEILIQCPFHSDGYVALLASEYVHSPGDQQERLVALTQASNRFFGTYHSVTGASAAPPHTPDRLGVVDESAGRCFERELTRTYLPPPIVSKTWSFSGQIVLPTKGHPVQAIQLRGGIPSAPLVASMRKPCPDRTIRRVAVWSGAGSMTEEIERAAVASAFRRAGAEVSVVVPAAATVDNFLELYQADSFDVVWLMSHGIFDHYSPKHASLIVDEEGGEVSIRDLLRRTPMGTSRRLFVLNVCDGGRFEEVGVLPRVGVAPAAASSCQATISHLWPVHGMSAAIFGVLLAKHLMSHHSYFDAFSHTLLDLHRCKADMIELLRDAVGESAEQLVDRIERTSVDFTNIAHWGSAVFYG